MKKFFKSIKFRLTFWYSAMLVLSCLVFVFVFNVFISNYFNRDLSADPYSQVIFQRHIPRRLRDLSEESFELLKESRHQDLQIIRELSMISFVPLVLFSFGGGYFIADRMLKPLKDLNDEIEDITADKLYKKIGFEDTGDEISELIENFNLMITRLNSSFVAQKQFVENASHELKTPLAIIKLNLEVLESKKSLKPTERKVYVSNIKDAITLMNRLLEDLLLLSSVERDISKVKMDLSKTVASSVRKLKLVLDNKKVKISVSKTNDVHILGNSSLVERSIMNVIENAIHYSPEGSKIVVRLIKKGDKAVLSVSDSGPGIPKKHRKRIFERFYRVDKSRSKETGGIGLGLSIVKDIMEKHDGKVSLKSSKKGSTFVLEFPVVG